MVLALHRAGGAKAVTFGAVAAGAGLAASSLVQRHGSVEGMVRDAQIAFWTRMLAEAVRAAADAPVSGKGAAALLKTLGEAAGQGVAACLSSDPAVAAAATAWRARVEADLALRLGGGAKGREAAAVLFAAWQGQVLWQSAGDRGFRLRDAVKRLTP